MGPLIFVLDNYDSFTYNLVQYLLEQGATVRVERNDAVTVRQVLDTGCRGIVLSPGPGRPESAGIMLDLIRAALGRVPLLGVCLGHQGIAQALGGRIVRAPRLMHGKTSPIQHDARGVFEGLLNPFEATRYHSLAVDASSVPADLVVTATTRDDGETVIMGLRHRDYPAVKAEGVQFHPESVLTLEGHKLVANFLRDAAC